MQADERIVNCVRQYVAELLGAVPGEQVEGWLRRPDLLWADAGPAITERLDATGASTEQLRADIVQQPFVQFLSLFDIADLPETPTAWLPVPNCAATQSAMLSIVLLSAICGMETVSYGSENDGHLFVNLVALPGEGAEAEKSTKAMRGHTDAATFPFPGSTDPRWPRIAPSPDVVFLAALRNPDAVPTVVMPLDQILTKLDPAHVAVLKGPNITISAQKSFARGTRAALGEVHVLDGANVLQDTEQGTWVRYTHRGTLPYDDEDEATLQAKAAFEAACATSSAAVTLNGGDLLMVNNRKALHGRAYVGGGIGGHSRWLIRSYGLNTTGVSDDQRHASPRHKLYP